MTKAEEIDVIDEAIAKLGADSYLGPWLKGIRDELYACIRSDHFPEITLDYCCRACEDFRKLADQYSTFTREQADIQAAKIVATARKLGDDIRHRNRRLLLEASETLS